MEDNKGYATLADPVIPEGDSCEDITPPTPIKTWHPDMTDKEAKDLAYWERNMLALLLANIMRDIKFHGLGTSGWYHHEGDGFEGWSRIISINDGSITFHVPDDFDLGTLPKIEPNWDGHTTEEKWRKIMKSCGCNVQ